MDTKIGSALIVGAGISGIRSALDLAELGYRVTLIDKAPNLGGTLRQLDYQFPNDHCGMCKMLPLVERDLASQFCLRKGLFHDNIEIMLAAELTGLEGEPGKFKATLRLQQNKVDPARCIGCGECSRVCPVEAPDEFNAGLGKRKAVYLPVPHNIPNHYVLDEATCTRCGECEKVCPTGAIDLQVEGEALHELEVGAVILAAGFGSFDPKVGKNTYGYGQFPNVVTSIELERLVSGTGPTGGKVLRPSDGREVRRVAWLQCVGSRNLQADADYCSSVCCMFSIKEALLLKERLGDAVDTTIFYMDMRTFGKDFQRYRDRAEQECGVRFVRSRVHTVEPEEREGDLRLSYTDIEGANQDAVFDLVVLATGQRPSAGMETMAGVTGVELNEWGFCRVKDFSTSVTAADGVFVSGSFSGLKDISESVVQASCASLAASTLLHSKGGSLAEIKSSPSPFRNVARELPQTAIVLCSCGGTLMEGAARAALTQTMERSVAGGQVIQVERLCTREGWAELESKLKGSRANRVLIGACLPYLYTRKLRELGEAIGLHPSLMEVVDIRTTASPGHQLEPSRLQGEIQTTLSMGLARLRGKDAMLPAFTPITQKALVVGGGLAGMTAALAIADHGFEVSLVEQSGELGGNLRHLYRTLEGGSPQELLERTVFRVSRHPQIKLFLNTRVIHSQGQVGRFLTSVEKEDGTGELLEHGVTILAAGGREAATEAYGYGSSPAIMTQHELEEALHRGAVDPTTLKAVAMIQCVDSREPGRNYCSRICCASALKHALYLKEKNPDLDVTIFYRDIMTYGFLETYYTQARRAGVIFVQYQVADKPRVTVSNGRIAVAALDPILGRELIVENDLVVLSPGIVPNGQKQLAEVFGVPLSEDGFFQEAESKWRPVDFVKEGIYTCGLAHSPRSLTEAVATAEAAAQRALGLLARGQVSGGCIAAEVRRTLCSLCERCIEACPFGARYRDEEDEQVVVNELMCQGCGTCAAVCPNSASVLRGFKDQQIHAILDAALEEIL